MIGSFTLVYRLVTRSLRQHIFSTSITVLSVALATGLMMSVFAINKQTYEAFTEGHGGFDAVLGARGSQTQLVLNSVFHLEASPGNIPWSLYMEIKNDRRVEHAIPYALGDNYYGYRIVGTKTELFDVEYREDRTPQLFEGGRMFDPLRREAVVGSFAARKTGLRVGSIFQPYHGLLFEEGTQHTEQFVVVGILEATNTPMDRVIWIPIEGVFRMEGHALRGTGEQFIPESNQAIPDEHKEVSAVMLTFRNQQVGMQLNQTINFQGKVATLAWPIGRIMSDLFDKIGWMSHILTLVAWLIIIVSAASIMASIYNSINERRRDIAILRSLGTRRRLVFTSIILESSIIALLGTLAGYAFYAVIISTALFIVREQTGVVLEVLQYHPVLVITPIGMTLLGALAGIMPAIKAYSTDVASYLTPTT